MGLNLHSLKRGRPKLEPISIDELACDSTMTGFSDLFRIPTAFRNPDVSRGLKPTSEILEPVRINTDASEAPPSETGPSVSALAADGFQASYSLNLVSGGSEDVPSETDPPVSDGTSSDPPVSESRNVYQRPIQTEKADINIGFMDDTGGVVSDPALSIDGAETDARDTGGFVSDASISMLSAPLQRKLQIREAKLVQEGHTYGEQTVYEALWKYGTVVSDQVRVITVGFLRMAGIAGLAESNCKAAVAGLLDKLTIERLPDRIIAQGRTYKVYNWSSVLSRRRTAGLTHVIKSRGVVFVDPKTGLPLTAAKTPPRRQKREVAFEAKTQETGQRETSSPKKDGSETGPPVSLPRYSAAQVSDLPTSYVNHLKSSESSPERSPILVVKPSPQNHLEIADLACRLRKDLDTAFDDSAAARLWRECRKSVLDCTVEEVMHFVLLKSHKIHRDPKIRNPIGLLLMSVPEFFNGNAVHELREQKRREEEQNRELQYQQRRYWKEVADDPSTPLDERSLAAKFLAELG